MSEFVTKEEHTEFCKRLEEHMDKQDSEIAELKNRNDILIEMGNAITEMSTNMKHLASDLHEQGRRLEAIENRDGKKFREIELGTIMLIIGAIVGAIFEHIM